MGQKQATCLDWCLSVNVNCMTQMILQALGRVSTIRNLFYNHSIWFCRALCVCCWSCCMISQNFFVTTTMGSVM